MTTSIWMPRHTGGVAMFAGAMRWVTLTDDEGCSIPTTGLAH